MERAYLDWNATAPLHPAARAAMLAAFEIPGNPSSVHAEGREARSIVESARESVAALVGTAPAQVTFTSGGTESNMLALTPAIERGADKAPREWLLVSAIEHPSVRRGGRFAAGRIAEVPVTAAGIVEPDALRAALREKPRALVSIMLANNETGVVQPISELAQIVHEAGAVLHVDAIQGPGRIDLDIGALGADLITLSAHKLGGPKGVGALVRATDALHIALPLIAGGGQERSLRAGTENVAGIAGFGAAAGAAKASLRDNAARMAGLRDRLEQAILETTPKAVIFGRQSPRLPNTTLVALPGAKAETAVIALDLAGVAVSSGAACSSGKVQPSHVLAAMGVEPALARAAIRVSLGPTTSAREVECFQNAWIKLAESLGKGGKGIAA